MGAFWRGVQRTVFWSYERGSWPYDLMVLVILGFVCLTPRHWFHDGARTGVPQQAGIQLLSGDLSTGVSIYRLDAKSLPAAKRSAKITPELERETHNIFQRDIAELNGRTFQILRIVPLRADDGSVLAYQVTIDLTKGM